MYPESVIFQEHIHMNIINNVKVEVSLHLIKQNDMKKYGGSEVYLHASLILDFYNSSLLMLFLLLDLHTV
jgi:hypothetical protein